MQPLRDGDPRAVGAYELRARLGQGGMGVVYFGLAPDRRPVAVKVIGEWVAHDRDFRARFHREVTAARRVTGPFTAAVLDDDPDAELPWLATEYLAGLSLHEAVAATGALPRATTRVLARGLAEALASIHAAGVVHRDLTPQNIMLTDDGPRVIDFGIARPEGAAAITEVGAAIGTRKYMSPEHLAGRRSGTPGDVYSLGAVLVFAATGSAPAPATGAWRRRLADRRVADLIDRCLGREPATRPSAAEVLDILDGPPVSLRGTGWLPRRVAERIHDRTERARVSREEFTVGLSVMAAETLDPPGEPTEEPRAPGRVPRRALIAGTGALLAAGTVWALTARHRSPGATLHAGASASPGAAGPPPSPTVLWRTQVSDFYPDLAVAGGVVLAHEDETLHGLSPDTGEILWKRDALTHTVAGGVPYIMDSSTFPWSLSALRPGTGEKAWNRDLDGGFAAPGPVTTGAVLAYGGETTSAVAVANGAPRWTVKVNSERGIAAGDGIVAALDTALIALDARTGEKRWTYAFTPNQVAGLTLGDGLVFAGDGEGVLHAVRTEDGELAWSRQVGFTGSAVFGDGVVHVCDFLGNTAALLAATGATLWTATIGAGEGRFYGHANTLGLIGGTLLVTATDKSLRALDRTNGDPLWTYAADVTPTSAAVATGGLYFAGTRDGHVVALEPPTGGADATAPGR
ncbi:protein kinase domain-containing protein [Phytomonospora endophytica]|uniref:Outer membrane protein assembly factor BamB n=1 Tax=Phytomonospora endophytica TaxID=714109 RepID=A0A841FR92_9ACTN|nr:serine/threonine-protein kinase [Phytomonospora endophytica]MBB6038725.1 outer membrane protein assembly factor BamB [Phytomonospora endophytica]GIG68479.1 hypothetical protein Pen01_47740 [Phytomonospora endophytica]